MRVAIIPADSSQPVRIEDVELTVDSLQEMVGGYFQVVGLGDPMNVNMFMDEEGRMKGKGVNLRATSMAVSYSRLGGNSLIVGDVVLIGPGDEEGNDTDLPDHAVESVTLLN